MIFLLLIIYKLNGVHPQIIECMQLDKTNLKELELNLAVSSCIVNVIKNSLMSYSSCIMKSVFVLYEYKMKLRLTIIDVVFGL